MRRPDLHTLDRERGTAALRRRPAYARRPSFPPVANRTLFADFASQRRRSFTRRVLSFSAKTNSPSRSVLPRVRRATAANRRDQVTPAMQGRLDRQGSPEKPSRTPQPPRRPSRRFSTPSTSDSRGTDAAHNTVPSPLQEGVRDVVVYPQRPPHPSAAYFDGSKGGSRRLFHSPGDESFAVWVLRTGLYRSNLRAASPGRRRLQRGTPCVYAGRPRLFGARKQGAPKARMEYPATIQTAEVA